MKHDQKIYTFTERLEQNTCTETKKAHFTFKNNQNIYFLIFRFHKRKLANTFMFYMKLSFSFDNNVLNYFKYNDLRHTLNVNKVLAKEHQVGGR